MKTTGYLLLTAVCLLPVTAYGGERVSRRENDMDLLQHELGRNLGDGATLNPPEFTQSPGKSSNQWRIDESAIEYQCDGRPLVRLLRSCGKRVRDCYSAKKCKKFTPSHRCPEGSGRRLAGQPSTPVGNRIRADQRPGIEGGARQLIELCRRSFSAHRQS